MFLWVDDVSGILFFYDEKTNTVQKILITYLDFIAYIETLARSHVDIAHEVNGKYAFTEFTQELIQSTSRCSELDVKHLLWGKPQITDASTSASNSLDNWSADILVLDRYNDESQQDKYDKTSECIVILQEFRSKFKEDGQITPSNWLKLFDHTSIRIHPVEFRAHKLIGARMEFKFRVSSNLFTNPEKWLSQ